MRVGRCGYFALVACITAACSEGESKPKGAAGSTGAGGSAGGGAGGVAGVGELVTSYTPDGCGYAVTLPASIQKGTRHGSAFGADPTPNHVHVSWAGPSSSTFSVNWRTGLDTELSQVLYGTDRAAVDAADTGSGSVKLQSGHTFRYAGTLFPDETRVHEVHVCGLSPDTTYYYKAGGPGHWSRSFDVATGPAPASPAAFRFLVAGDSRNRMDVWASSGEKIRGEAPDFVVFTGDAVAIGANQRDWNAWFEATTGVFAVEELLARTPVMMVNGNHEALALNYFAQFAFPQDLSTGEMAEGEQWYSFDYAGAHFAMLDSTILQEQQADWLRADLAKVDRRTTPWIFVAFHYPPYSCSNHGSDMSVRTRWQPVFDEFKVDIVLTGHDHNYERSLPLRGLDAANQGIPAQATGAALPVAESGTLYVVTGGSGAPLYDNGTCPHTHLSEKIENYVVIDIDGRTLRYQAKRLDGSQIESFEYSK
jgi:3',5'-cyclic AMP phosphodiesterase CpdA